MLCLPLVQNYWYNCPFSSFHLTNIHFFVFFQVICFKWRTSPLDSLFSSIFQHTYLCTNRKQGWWTFLEAHLFWLFNFQRGTCSLVSHWSKHTSFKIYHGFVRHFKYKTWRKKKTKKKKSKWLVRHLKYRTWKNKCMFAIFHLGSSQKKVKNSVCSPNKMKNKGNCINNFELGVDISFFFLIGSEEKKNSKTSTNILVYQFFYFHCNCIFSNFYSL